MLHIFNEDERKDYICSKTNTVKINITIEIHPTTSERLSHDSWLQNHHNQLKNHQLQPNEINKKKKTLTILTFTDPEKKNVKFSSFDELCDDVIYVIFEFVKFEDRLNNLSCVCQQFYMIVNCDYFWRTLTFSEKISYKLKGNDIDQILSCHENIEILDLRNWIIHCHPDNFEKIFKNSLNDPFHFLDKKRKNLQKVILSSELCLSTRKGIGNNKNEFFRYIQKKMKKYNPKCKVEYIKPDNFYVVVATLTGKRVIVNVPNLEITFFDLKVLVYEKLGIFPDAQRYIYAGCECEDGRRLNDYRLMRNGALLHLVLRLRGG